MMWVTTTRWPLGLKWLILVALVMLACTYNNNVRIVGDRTTEASFPGSRAESEFAAVGERSCNYWSCSAE